MDQSGQQERQGSPSDPSHRPWNDSEIRIFLMEWEVVEQEVGHKGQKTCKKVRAIRQRLCQRGLRKTWQDCLQLMTDLKTLHWRLSRERAGVEPLFSPYSEHLYRILGHRQEWSPCPGPLYDGAGNPMLHMYSQPPMVWPTPVYQPWDYGFPVPSGELQGNPPTMTYSGHS
nr:putative uncharacterized protein MSANTD5 [Peromyscus maniculatus bairdii]